MDPQEAAALLDIGQAVLDGFYEWHEKEYGYDIRDEL